jgi:hypothetical protein
VQSRGRERRRQFPESNAQFVQGILCIETPPGIAGKQQASRRVHDHPVGNGDKGVEIETGIVKISGELSPRGFEIFKRRPQLPEIFPESLEARCIKKDAVKLFVLFGLSNQGQCFVFRIWTEFP